MRRLFDYTSSLGIAYPVALPSDLSVVHLDCRKPLVLVLYPYIEGVTVVRYHFTSWILSRRRGTTPRAATDDTQNNSYGSSTTSQIAMHRVGA